MVILCGACVFLFLGCAQRGMQGGSIDGPILFKFLVDQSHTFRMNVEVHTVAEASGMTYNISTSLEMLVAPIGDPPAQATFRADSASASLAPARGSR